MINESDDPKPARPDTSTPGPEVHIGVGIDKAANKVYLEIKTEGGGEKSLHARVHFEEKEVADLCMTLVRAATALRGGKPGGPLPLVVIPTRDGAINPKELAQALRPTVKFPGIGGK